MNWGDAKIMARTYLHRMDIDLDAAQIPACDRMTQLLDVQDNEAVASVDLVVGEPTGLFSGPVAPDYGRMKTVMVNGASCRSLPFMSLWKTGEANAYAVMGNSLYSSAAGTAQYAYGRQIQPIDTDTGDNAILIRYPRVYLYAVVIEAFIQIQDFDAAGGYVPAFEGAVDDANALQAFARYDSSMAVTPAFRRV
jgi:hypothetical protein